MLVHHVANNHGMLLGSTEDDGLFVRVDLVQELLHTMLVALLNLDSAIIEIRLRVNLFRVHLSAFHDVAFLILIVIDVARRDVHTEGYKEAVLDALFQRVGIYRISKVSVGIGIVLSSGCGCHAQLIGTVEVFHQLSPLAFVISSTSVTLIDDDEVEEVTLILHVIGLVVGTFRQLDALLLCLLRIGRSHHGLEDGEIKIAGSWNSVIVLLQFLGCDAAHRIFRKLVEVVDGLVGQNVPIGNEQDSWGSLNTLRTPFCLRQFPTNLESCVGLSCSCGHRQQNAVVLLGHSLQHILDGYLLIVARLATTAAIQGAEIELVAPRICLREGHLPQILWRWEVVDIPFFAGDDIISIA